jgi:hypothetical protein
LTQIKEGANAGNIDLINDSTEGVTEERMETEPLDHIQEVLEELRNKVLTKFKYEIEETESSYASVFKLKAQQTDAIY